MRETGFSSNIVSANETFDTLDTIYKNRSKRCYRPDGRHHYQITDADVPSAEHNEVVVTPNHVRVARHFEYANKSVSQSRASMCDKKLRDNGFELCTSTSTWIWYEKKVPRSSFTNQAEINKFVLREVMLLDTIK